MVGGSLLQLLRSALYTGKDVRSATRVEGNENRGIAVQQPHPPSQQVSVKLAPLAEVAQQFLEKRNCRIHLQRSGQGHDDDIAR